MEINFESVDKTISPRDSMFQGNLDHYFYVGFSAIRCISSALTITDKDPSSVEYILDLPCGYGRITRWLAAAFPGKKITACDLEKDGVDFCRDQFGAVPVYSDIDTTKIRFSQKFDLIWCGSLFTHMNNENWTRFFRLFDSLLKPDGVVVFTVHGRYVALRFEMGFDYGVSREIFQDIIKDYQKSGYGYHDYYSTPGYGVSLVKPAYVFRMMELFPDLTMAMYQEKGWDHHQDVVALYKDSTFKEKYFDYPGAMKEIRK